MGLTDPRVGIIGGTGKMGSWLARLLEARGLTVLRAGRRTELTPAEVGRQCDVVVISVPIADTVRIIREVGPLISEDRLLMDLTSVKKEPVKAMLAYSRAQVVGVHPLFGPPDESKTDLKVALCPGRGQGGLAWVKGLFLSEGFHVSVLEPEKHDSLMGIVQAVNHFSNLALALCVHRSDFRLEELEGVSTRNFSQRLDRIRSTLRQPAELFGSLLMDNPAAGEPLETFLASVERLIRITRDRDKGAFTEQFESLRKVFENGISGI